MYVRLRTTELHTVLVHYSLSENLAVASPAYSIRRSFSGFFLCLPAAGYACCTAGCYEERRQKWKTLSSDKRQKAQLMISSVAISGAFLSQHYYCIFSIFICDFNHSFGGA